MEEKLTRLGGGVWIFGIFLPPMTTNVDGLPDFGPEGDPTPRLTNATDDANVGQRQEGEDFFEQFVRQIEGRVETSGGETEVSSGIDLIGRILQFECS